jgi:soluble lytic murein transglycosylase-like protein
MSAPQDDHHCQTGSSGCGVRQAWPLLLAACCALPAQAQVFGGESASGSLVLSYMPTAEATQLVVDVPAVVPEAPLSATPEALASEPLLAVKVPALSDQYRKLILKVAREQRVSAPLIAAVAAAESGFDARARSPKGAVGLMQLMPETARRFRVADRLSPEQSVRGGAAYLRWLNEHFNANLEHVIAAYNAGESAVDRAGGLPPYAETRAYLPRVMGYLRHFTQVFGQIPA